MSRRRYATQAEKRLDEASRWFVILQQPNLSPRTLEIWKRWETIPENRLVFDELERLWAALDAVDPPSMPTLAATVADTYDGSESVASWNERSRLRTQQDTARRHESSRRSWFVALAAPGLVCVAAGMFALKYRHVSTEARVDVFETMVGEHKDIVLGDGSRIQLGARSSVNVTMSEHFRTVVLDHGEALFTVAHDRSRPFNVMAGNGTITAVGTAFNVRRREDNHVVVTVTEGTVQITPKETDEPHVPSDARRVSISSPPLRLEHGHEISYGTDGSFSNQRRSDDSVLAWRCGCLHYRQEPLRNVIPDINRYSRRSIVLGDRLAGELLFTGTVFERDIDQWIDNLESVYPLLEVTASGVDDVLIRTRPLTTKE